MRLNARSIAIVILLSILSVFLFVAHVQSLTHSVYEQPMNTVEDLDPIVVPETPPPSYDTSETPEPDIHLPAFRRMQLALARICVSESGFQTRTNDCTLIYHALRTRSRTGEVTMGIMRAYSGRTFDRSRTDRHRWIAHLDHNFREPSGWSETVTIPWSTRREGFEQVYNHVGDLLRSRPANTCGVRIDHWGARGFRRELHLSNGWELVNCGETLNDFWTIPSDDSEDESELKPEIATR